MDAIEAVLTRQSCAKLREPAPTGSQRETIFRAALTAPDHARLHPWRFLVIEGDGRQQLGQLMLDAALKSNATLDRAKREKLLNAPLRAPLVIVSIASVIEHPKVPAIEQVLSVGASVSQMLVAIHALGYAAIWRTGDAAFNRDLMQSLGLTSSEQIVGFLYVGTADAPPKTSQQLSVQDYYSTWPSL